MRPSNARVCHFTTRALGAEIFSSARLSRKEFFEKKCGFFPQPISPLESHRTSRARFDFCQALSIQCTHSLPTTDRNIPVGDHTDEAFLIADGQYTMSRARTVSAASRIVASGCTTVTSRPVISRNSMGVYFHRAIHRAGGPHDDDAGTFFRKGTTIVSPPPFLPKLTIRIPVDLPPPKAALCPRLNARTARECLSRPIRARILR